MPIPALTRFVKRHYGRRSFVSGMFSRLVDACVDCRTAGDYRRMEPYMQGVRTVLDIGVGGGMIYRALRARGYDMTGVDVVDLSMYPDVSPMIYNGSYLDFPDKHFDAALLDRVLHHCGKNQEAVLKEALRVAKRVLIIEDVYCSKIEKALVALNDSVANWEWYKHYYRDTIGWKQMIESFGAKVIHQETWCEVPQWTVYAPHALLVVETF